MSIWTSEPDVCVCSGMTTTPMQTRILTFGWAAGVEVPCKCMECQIRHSIQQRPGCFPLKSLKSRLDPRT